MILSRRRFISITAGVTLGGIGFGAASAFAKTAKWRGVALGADARLVINGLPKGEADRLISLARDEIKRLENIFSIYLPASEISQLNLLGELKLPSPELLKLCSMVDVIHTISGGMFDPTIQPLWSAYAKHKGKPSKGVLKNAVELVDWKNIDIDSDLIKFTKPEMAITLNGIAQGYITDRIVQLLKAEGLSSAVVKMGEISAIGQNSKNQPWKIGIAQFGDEKAEEFIEMTDQSIATSSALGTTFDGKNSHIINPRTGISARSYWQRISVVHASSAMADGISTAAILMDENQIKKMLSETSDVRLIAKNTASETLNFKS